MKTRKAGNKGIQKKTLNYEKAFVHDAVNLSNSFMEDLERLGKFYEKHKSYINPYLKRHQKRSKVQLPPSC